MKRPLKSEAQASDSLKLAREAALKAAYAITVGGASKEEAMTDDVLGHTFATGALEFASTLVSEATTNALAQDERYVSHLATGWNLERLAVMDRLILRLACAELWKVPGTPPKVVLSEFVRLAETYGSSESRKFVNGVLAKVLPTSPKADWTPPGPMEKPKRRKVALQIEPVATETAGKKWVIKSDR